MSQFAPQLALLNLIKLLVKLNVIKESPRMSVGTINDYVERHRP